MNKCAISLLVLTALLAGYAIGVVRATRKSMREDRLGPALFAIAAARASESKDTAKVEKVDRLRLKRAIEEVAALGETNWTSVIFDSPRDVEGYPQFMATIADYVLQHPELEINASARSYLTRFKQTGLNQSQSEPAGG